MPIEVRKGHWHSWTAVLGSCELLHRGFWEQNSGPFQEQHMLSTTEPSLSPHTWFFFWLREISSFHKNALLFRREIKVINGQWGRIKNNLNWRGRYAPKNNLNQFSNLVSLFGFQSEFLSNLEILAHGINSLIKVSFVNTFNKQLVLEEGRAKYG